MKKPELRPKENVLAREHSFFCSAFVQHVYRQIGIDLRPASTPSIPRPKTSPRPTCRTRVGSWSAISAKAKRKSTGAKSSRVSGAVRARVNRQNRILSAERIRNRPRRGRIGHPGSIDDETIFVITGRQWQFLRPNRSGFRHRRRCPIGECAGNQYRSRAWIRIRKPCGFLRCGNNGCLSPCHFHSQVSSVVCSLTPNSWTRAIDLLPREAPRCAEQKQTSRAKKDS